MNFAEAVLKKSSTPIHYIWGVNGNDEEFYLFVCCSFEKYARIKEFFGKGAVNVEDYGIVIAKGTGRIPDEATRHMLVQEYKVNWDDFKEAMYG